MHEYHWFNTTYILCTCDINYVLFTYLKRFLKKYTEMKPLREYTKIYMLHVLIYEIFDKI